MTRRFFGFVFIASLFLSLFVSNNTNAWSSDVYITNTTGGMRGFSCFKWGWPIQNPDALQSYNGTWLESWNVPSVIFGSVPSGYQTCAISGVVYSANINGGDNSNKYNMIDVIARFQQAPFYDSVDGKTYPSSLTDIDFQAIMGYQLSNGDTGVVDCHNNARDDSAFEWQCKLATDNYTKVTAISIQWGPYAYPPTRLQEYHIAEIGTPGSVTNNNPISLATWRYKWDSSMDPTPAMLQNIDNSINNLNNNIININNSIDDHYNEEKSEENAREQQGQQDSADLSGLFNFSVINPLNALYSAVSANTQCVNIPTIAAMLNVQDTQYCNWFPQSVRNILTPVISLTSMMLVFGYLVSWLRQSSSPTVDIIERK